MNFALENVRSVYTGAAHACCCGCKGKHSYPEAARGKGKELRGYEISEDEISPRAVKMALTRINGALAGTNDYVMVEGWEEELEKYGHLAALNAAGTRMTVVYLNK